MSIVHYCQSFSFKVMGTYILKYSFSMQVSLLLEPDFLFENIHPCKDPKSVELLLAVYNEPNFLLLVTHQ